MQLKQRNMQLKQSKISRNTVKLGYNLRCKGLQIDIEHWVSHWNIEKIDIDIDIEYLFNVLIFHIDIELNSMFEIQYIEKLLNVFNVSMLLNVAQCFSMFLNVFNASSLILIFLAM